ncbi:MAG TPA: hypothetical protein VMD91_06155 [Candidatus Sulfotelmatobacter sp.]|nr:hypothetical protein [Candidatus Sulfotelmatobacter sp.]
MRQGFLLACAVACAVGLAGCGGGRGVGASLPGAAQAAQKQRVTFAIDVPKASGASNRRAPQYISPATTQLAIDITQGGTPVAGYPTTIPLTPTSAGCSSTLASTQCQLTISLGAGSYVATLTAEDAARSALSTAQSIAFTVSAGTNTTVPLVLSGVPAAVTAQLLPGSSNQLVVNAYDADENLIIGPGAPSFTVAQSSGIAVTITQPSTTAPNVATVVPSTAGTAVLTVTAAYGGSGVTNACALGGAVCTANVTLTSTLPFFVASHTTDGIAAHPTPYANDGYTVLQNPGAVQGIASDATGDLFASIQSGSVAEYTAPYSGAPSSTFAGFGYADVVGTNGDLFVESNFGQAEIFAPPYTGTPTVVGTSAGSSYPGFAIALSPAGELAILLEESVSVFAPPYTGTPTSVSVSFPTDVTFDAAGDLFVVEGVAGTVTVYAPPYTGTPTTLNGAVGVDGPYAVAVDAGGNLYVANNSNNTVTEYAPPFTGSPIATISSGLDEPTALAFDRAGDLLVANYGNDMVQEFVPPYTGTPTSIPAGVHQPSLLAVAGGYAVSVSP